jgi:5-methylcytosine-specific restriction endonuclease McrA
MQKYCSRLCYGKAISGHRTSLEHRVQLSRAKTANYKVRKRAELARKQREYHQRHPEISEQNDLKRRMRRKQGRNDLTRAQWEVIKASYKFRCAYCGCKPKRLTRDHIIPLALGGEHTMSNIVPACGPCNSKKWIKGPLVPVQPLLL